jgi:O-antigen ligase
MKYFIFLIILLTTVGELYRLNIGPESGVLLTDFAIPAFVAAYFLAGGFRTWYKDIPKSFYWFLAFASISLIGLLLSLTFLEPDQVMTGAMYWVRTVSYGVFGLFAYQELKKTQSSFSVLQVVFIAASILVVLGFAQLVFFPDLAWLVQDGWDPHRDRLVSSWIDPNFIGGFFALIFVLFLPFVFKIKNKKQRYFLIFALLIIETALFFTFSRSAYLAFFAGVFLVSMLSKKRAFFIVLLIFVAQLGLSSYGASRVMSAVENRTEDPTANFRIQSWKDAIKLTSEKPLFGYGYNNLATIKTERDLLRSESDHSASGSDSSLLTVLATGGILGFIPFFLFYLFSFIEAAKRRKEAIALGFMGVIAVLFVHSIFVNSLLFPPMMIFFWASWAIFQASSDTRLLKGRAQK